MRTAAFLMAGSLLMPAFTQNPQTPTPPATKPSPQAPVPPAKQSPPAPAPSPTKQSPQTSGRVAAPRLSIGVLVTNMQGRTLEDVWVKASGPVDREGPTEADGTIAFNNVTAGAYRLRFEHKDYITLERDVTVQAGRSLKASVSLNAAPPAPVPPVQQAAPPPQSSAPTAPPGQPTSVSIPDFVEHNYVGSAPALRSPIGCSGNATAVLLQLREPLAEHVHQDGDEMLYVVAGEGTHRIGGKENGLAAGTFAVVPRGMSHAIARRGSRPIIVLSMLSGPACTGK